MALVHEKSGGSFELTGKHSCDLVVSLGIDAKNTNLSIVLAFASGLFKKTVFFVFLMMAYKSIIQTTIKIQRLITFTSDFDTVC